MTISKVTSIAATGKEPYASAHGLLYEFKVAFSDGVSGVVNAKAATGPAYKVGEMVGYEITGEFNGVNKVKVDKKAAANWSQHPAGNAPASASLPKAEYVESRPTSAEGDVPIHGASVGMAVKEALALLTREKTHDEVIEWLCSPISWKSLHEVSSDIIRVMQHLERGKLAPTCKDRAPTKVEVPY